MIRTSKFPAVGTRRWTAVAPPILVPAPLVPVQHIGAVLAIALAVFSTAAWSSAQTLQSSNASSDRGGARWTFRSLSPVTVHSPIVRLGDVAVPVGGVDAAWERLSQSAVGLVPLDGSPMTLERDRLTRLIRNGSATVPQIDWVGPAHLVVNYRAGDRSDATAPMRHTSSRVATASASLSPSSTDTVGTIVTGSLDTSTARRVVHWIERGIDTLTPEITEQFAVTIDPHQAGLVPLETMAAVTTLKPMQPLVEGAVKFHVVGRSVDGEVKSEVTFTLTRHPQVVVPRKSLGRGHRITASDLELKPVPQDRMSPEYFVDPKAPLGMEVRSSVRAGHPIQRDDLGAPILVHRGDLIEVQVVGGGIRVSTNAKSLDDGSASDLIEIETLQPRKRLVARVLQPGLVEIVTRAPQVLR